LVVRLKEDTELRWIKVCLQGEGSGAWILQYTTEKPPAKFTDGEDANSTLVDIELNLFGDDKNNINFHPAGRYSYSFQFRVPTDLPYSFRSPPERNLGSAKYWLRALVEKPNRRRKAIRLPIVINPRVDRDALELANAPDQNLMYTRMR